MMKLMKRIQTAFRVLRGYSAISPTNLPNWRGNATRKDEELRYSLVELRSKARDLSNNNALVKRYLELLSVNIIGSDGILLQAKGSDEKINAQIEDAWYAWTESRDCSITGDMTFRELQELIMMSVARDGEIFVMPVRSNTPSGVSIQLVEPDYIDVNMNDSSRNIIMGIQLTQTRRPLKYFITPPTIDTMPITHTAPIERSASQIIHIYKRERADQTRGVTWIAPVMLNLKMLAGWIDASVTRARATAELNGFFTSETGDIYEGDTSTYDDFVMQSEPGVYKMLPKNVKFTSFDPDFPTTSFEPFTKAVMKNIATGLGVSYAALAGDLTEVNYSSIRAGVLEERENYKRLQSWFIEGVMRPIFTTWLKSAGESGLLPKLNSYPVQFHARRWQWVDPLKDVKANIDAINAGLKTRQQAISENGGDVYETFSQLRYEQDLAKEFNLNFENDNGTTIQSTADSE